MATSGITGLTGIAANDLGLGGALSEQVNGATDEMRKKRMLEQQQRGLGTSLAVTSIFGTGGGYAGY